MEYLERRLLNNNNRQTKSCDRQVHLIVVDCELKLEKYCVIIVLRILYARFLAKGKIKQISLPNMAFCGAYKSLRASYVLLVFLLYTGTSNTGWRRSRPTCPSLCMDVSVAPARPCSPVPSTSLKPTKRAQTNDPSPLGK